MYGAQAALVSKALKRWFENDVKMYGAQATSRIYTWSAVFENDVKMYGAQAQKQKQILMHSLRMM